MVYHRATHITELRTFTEFPTLLLQHAFSSFTMPVQTQEARIILVIEAIRTSNRKLSRRNAAKIYYVPKSNLRLRINGATSRSDIQPNCLKLTKLEEETIVRHVFDRDSRGFSPRLANVEDIANYLLEARKGKRVGKNWAQRFVSRRPELKTRFNRVYDFQRALYEDPELISAWFRLVENIRAKYSVVDSDFYNFDKTGFIIGRIYPGMVVTRADRRSKSKVV